MIRMPIIVGSLVAPLPPEAVAQARRRNRSGR